MSRDMQHIMIDNETLGTRADSVIISIGAVKFNPRPGNIFLIEKNEIAQPEFLEDCTIVCVKSPSVPGDKYEVKE